MEENPSANVGDLRKAGLIPGLARSPGGGHGDSHQYFAWRIPWTKEPSRLYSPWGCKELDLTDRLSTHAYPSIHVLCIFFYKLRSYYGATLTHGSHLRYFSLPSENINSFNFCFLFESCASGTPELSECGLCPELQSWMSCQQAFSDLYLFFPFNMNSLIARKDLPVARKDLPGTCLRITFNRFLN